MHDPCYFERMPVNTHLGNIWPAPPPHFRIIHSVTFAARMLSLLLCEMSIMNNHTSRRIPLRALFLSRAWSAQVCHRTATCPWEQRATERVQLSFPLLSLQQLMRNHRTKEVDSRCSNNRSPLSERIIPGDCHRDR